LIAVTGRQPQGAEQRDHCGVVRAVLGPRIDDAHAEPIAQRTNPRPKTAVRTDAAGNDQSAGAGRLDRALALDRKRVDDCFLECASCVRTRLVVELASAQRNDDRGLEPAEAEVESRLLGQRPRKSEHAVAPLLCELRELWTSGQPEPEHLRGLVECFAGRVVETLAEDPV